MTLVEDNRRQDHMRIQGKRKTWFRDAHKQQILFVVIMIVLAITTLTVDLWPVSIVLALLTPAGVYRYERGLGYQLPRIWVRDLFIHAKGDELFDGANRKVPVIELQDAEFPGKIGTTIDHEKNTFTLYIAYKGFRWELADPADRKAALQRYCQGVKRAIAESYGALEWGHTGGNRPFDPTKWAQTTRKYFMHKGVQAVYEEALSVEQVELLAQRSPEEWLRLIKSGEATTEQCQAVDTARQWDKLETNNVRFVRYAYLIFDRPDSPEYRNKPPEDYTPEEFAASTMGRALAAMHDGMVDAGFLEVEVLSRKQVREEVIAPSWNALHAAAAEESNTGSNPSDSVPIWPRTALRATRKTLTTDDNCHAVLTFTNFLNDTILPDGMDTLFMGNPQGVLVSLHAMSISAGRERFFARQMRNLTQGSIDERGGPHEDEDLDKLEAGRDAVDALYHSGSDAVRYNVSVLCSGAPDTIEEVVAYMERKLQLEGHSTIQRSGRSTMARDVWSGPLGVRPSDR